MREDRAQKVFVFPGQGQNQIYQLSLLLWFGLGIISKIFWVGEVLITQLLLSVQLHLLRVG